jgi:hypothetical protein
MSTYLLYLFQVKMANIFRRQSKKDVFWGFLPEHRYTSYGKVKWINPKKLIKKAVIFDTLVPLTFFIPVILACLVFIVTLGKEFKITLQHD